MSKYLKIISITVVLFTCVSCIDFWDQATFNDGTLAHTVYGNYAYKSGGHLQSGLKMLDKLNIRYDITETFANGVRVGKIKAFNDGDSSGYYDKKHAWFPKSWNTITLKNAVRYILNNLDHQLDIKRNKLGQRITLHGEYKNVRLFVIVEKKLDNKSGKYKNTVITAYPDYSSQPSLPVKYSGKTKTHINYRRK